MKLSKSDEKAYPGLLYYVKKDLPTVIKVPKIVKALEKNGEIKKRKLKTVLQYGIEPTLKVVAMPKNQCGEFSPNTSSNELRISKSLVKEFEKSGGAKKITLLVGATILHELSHWGDDRDGADIPGEEGDLFEKAAYGHVIPCKTK